MTNEIKTYDIAKNVVSKSFDGPEVPLGEPNPSSSLISIVISPAPHTFLYSIPETNLLVSAVSGNATGATFQLRDVSSDLSKLPISYDYFEKEGRNKILLYSSPKNAMF